MPGTTISLTNPGGIGTNHSVPRLMAGQSAIIGVGALDYPAEFQGSSDQTIGELAVSKIITSPLIHDGVMRVAEQDEIPECSAVLGGHSWRITRAVRLSSPDVGDLQVRDGISVNEADNRLRASRPVASASAQRRQSSTDCLRILPWIGGQDDPPSATDCCAVDQVPRPLHVGASGWLCKRGADNNYGSR